MKTYVANFKLRLPIPIEAAETSLPDLSLTLPVGCLRQVLIRVAPANGKITHFQITATYSDETLDHLSIAGGTEADGILVVAGTGKLIPPWEVVHTLVQPMLHRIAAATLQANVFWSLEDNLAKWVTDFHWSLPDGRTLANSGLEYPGKIFPDLKGAGERQMVRKDWDELQQLLNGNTVPLPPLWRSILAEAHRDRMDDLRNVVIHAATALDVGCQPLMPAGRLFNMSVLRGEGVKTPDLRQADLKLYETLSKLWFTRHGVVHRGEWQLYDNFPASGVKPLRGVIPQDVDEFLIAVPKGIAYVETNPP